MNSRLRGERGSTLAALVLMLAVGAIFMTVAASKWDFLSHRDKEKELIFRGTEIARGIQEYTAKFGRAPSSFDEMIKSKPPMLRQAYPDPLTVRYDREGKVLAGTGAWIKSRTGAPPPPVTSGLGAGQQTEAPPPELVEVSEESAEGSLNDRGRPSIGPLPGVQSTYVKVKESDWLSIGSFQDNAPESEYHDWLFQPPTANTSAPGIQGEIERLDPPGFGGYRVPGGPPYNGGVPSFGPPAGAGGRGAQSGGRSGAPPPRAGGQTPRR